MRDIGFGQTTEMPDHPHLYIQCVLFSEFWETEMVRCDAAEVRTTMAARAVLVKFSQLISSHLTSNSIRITLQIQSVSFWLFFGLNLCLFHVRVQTRGVWSAVPSPSMFGLSRLRDGLPPLCSQNIAAMSAATKGCQVTYTTLLPHRSHHY